jgi:hypothetical protein
MPLQMTHTYTVAEGKTFISFTDWVATLSPEDQAAVAAAEAEKKMILDQNRAAGYLTSVDNVYEGRPNRGPVSAVTEVYTDEALQLINQGKVSFGAMSWKTWFNRYQTETGITYSTNSQTV